MAHFRQFWTCVLFLMVAAIHVQAQITECYVNDENPHIEENNLPGYVVTTIVKGPGVTVTIDTEETEYPEFFEINGTQLILTHSLDYENITATYVMLKCWRGDVELTSVGLTVSVVNMNDNSPVFKEANITVSINEDIKVNTTVVPQADVTATDADLDTVFYNLTGSPLEATDYFKIRGVNNPAIYLHEALDYEKLNFMQLTLYAMDRNASAPGVHTATATITVHILQADLRPPWFQPCSFTADSKVCINRGYTGRVNVSEMTTGPLILKPGPLYAVDGDISLNEKIEYRIVDGNDNDTFSVNIDTGNITMNKPVNTLRTFLLYVMASQANNPFRFSQTVVEISIVRRNDHKPHFEKAAYLGTVPVDQPIRSLVMDAEIPLRPLRIFAADEDFPDKVNPDVTYQIQNSTDFTVSQDGFLLTAVVLNSAATMTLLAIANDKTTMEEASTLIIIDVTPLASTTTVPTTTTTTTTPNTPETRTTISDPTGSLVTTGINNTLSTTSSGSSTILPISTTSNAGLTGSPGTNASSGPIIPPLVTTVMSPIITVNASQSQTTRSPITGINQASTTSNAGLTGSPGTNTSSGPIIPPLVTTVMSPIITVNSSQSQTTRSPITGINQASTTSNAGLTGSPGTNTSSGPIIPPLVTTVMSPIITVNSSQSQTTRSPITGISQASRTSNAGVTGRPTTASGPIIPPLVTTATSSYITMNASQSWTTSSPITRKSQATIAALQSTTRTTTVSQAGSTKSPITAIEVASPSTARITSQSNSAKPLTTTSGTVQSAAHSSATRTTLQSPGLIAKSTTRSVTSVTTASSAASLPSTQISSTDSSPAECDCEEMDMIILGATLGSLLAITLVLLLIMIYKYYRSSWKEKDGEDSDQLSLVSSNHYFQDDEKHDSGENDNKSLASDESARNDPVTKLRSGTPPPWKKAVESSQASSRSAGTEEGEEGAGSHESGKEVKSILTKDRRLEEDGYKAVWFKEDINPEAEDDVMMIEADSDAEQSRNDEDSDDGDDEGEGDHRGSGRGSSDVSFVPEILLGDGPNGPF